MLAVASKKAEEIDATSADLMIVQHRPPRLPAATPLLSAAVVRFCCHATQCARVTVFLHFVSLN
jgi:hypothetical protein